jgi:farnesyl diphosphate synthase
VERARAQAEALADQASAQLESFGAKADLLRALANYVVARRS